MALAVVRRFFSGSTDGLPIQVARSSNASATVHTGSTSTGVMDEIYMYAMMDVTRTAANTVIIQINSQCFTQEVPVGSVDFALLTGFPLWGRSAAGTVVSVYASSTANLFVYGYVNRVTES